MPDEPIVDGWTIVVVGVVSFCLGVIVGASLVRT